MIVVSKLVSFDGIGVVIVEWKSSVCCFSSNKISNDISRHRYCDGCKHCCGCSMLVYFYLLSTHPTSNNPSKSSPSWRVRFLPNGPTSSLLVTRHDDPVK